MASHSQKVQFCLRCNPEWDCGFAHLRMHGKYKLMETYLIQDSDSQCVEHWTASPGTTILNTS